MTASMAGVVKSMDAAMKRMKLEEISSLMDKFEQQFEDLDVQSSYMENTMSQTTTTSVPQGDVDSLLQKVADEAGYTFELHTYHSIITINQIIIIFFVSIVRLELNMELPNGPQSTTIGQSTQVSQEQDELTQRLARLRQTE